MKRKILSSIFWVTNLNVVTYLFNFLISVLIIRNVDQITYGNYAAGLVFADNIFMLLAVQFGSSIVQYDRSKFNDKVVNIAARYSLINVKLIFAVSLVCAFIIFYKSHFVVFATFIILIFSSSLNALSLLIFSIYEKQLDFKKQAVIMQFSSLLSLFAALILFYLEFGIYVLIIKEIVKASSIAYFLRKDYISFLNKDQDKNISKTLLIFSIRRHIIKMFEVSFYRTPFLVMGFGSDKKNFADVNLSFNFSNQIMNIFVSVIQKVGLSTYSYDARKQDNLFDISGFLTTRFFLVFIVLLNLFGDKLFSLVFGETWTNTSIIFAQFFGYIYLLPNVSNMGAFFLSKGWLNRIIFVWVAGNIALYFTMVVNNLNILDLGNYLFLSMSAMYLLYFVFVTSTYDNLFKKIVNCHIYLSPYLFLLSKNYFSLVAILLLDIIIIRKRQWN